MKPQDFRNCKVQYAYDRKQKMYSVLVMLNKQLRVVTLRMGDKFTELSLSDRDGNVLEMLRQEEGKGVTAYRREE
jgi:hypothetical protein